MMDKEEERLIERASVPNLAALFRKAKDAGLIEETQEYK